MHYMYFTMVNVGGCPGTPRTPVRTPMFRSMGGDAGYLGIVGKLK